MDSSSVLVDKLCNMLIFCYEVRYLTTILVI